MSGRKKGPKAQIHAAKPEPPPFIARLREQIVANEDADRRERSEKRRREMGSGRVRGGDDDDDPTVVKVNEEDLTEEEYKRMKLGKFQVATLGATGFFLGLNPELTRPIILGQLWRHNTS